MKRGAFIVMEGCDRSGKTSQSKNIVNYLLKNNVPAEWMCFPDRTTLIGKVIGSYLRSESQLSDQAIHLLFSANRWEAVPKIKEKLNAGITLVCDRYSYSGVAYSFAKKEAFDLEWYKSPEKGLPKPDLVLYLNLSTEVIKKRGGFGEERYEKEEFQESVSRVFDMLRDDYWKIIDADTTEEKLTDVLIKEVMPVLDDLGELSVMW